MEKIRIRKKHPGSATLLSLVTNTDVDSDPETSCPGQDHKQKKTGILISNNNGSDNDDKNLHNGFADNLSGSGSMGLGLQCGSL
jgi:hypothetical protein